ncbi:conserved transmembrane domain protein [Mycobacterium ulcerans str. Harvey]|uniref:Conserved transmembrane domain protein n=1 Tax=Mycobacterium ulcerans str. Harvey TaxID=1299332 RepID=A0ABN0R8J2_MYCUL|nr:conserved transmembrane domain protein [Mycobacterium ulcerans str. Harvey]
MADRYRGGPPLTYGVIALAIVPYGALGIPWNGWTALVALAVVTAAVTGFQLLLGRFRDKEAEARGVSRGPALTVAAGVALGTLFIAWAAYRGIPHWQSIPAAGTRSGTPTPCASFSTPARPPLPTWASCATSKPMRCCTTPRCFMA